MKVMGGITITFGIPGAPVVEKPDALDCLLDDTKVRWDTTNGLQVSIAGEEIPMETLVQTVEEATNAQG